MSKDIAININGVTKIYKLFVTKTERMKEALHPFKKKYHKEFHALHDINLEIRTGEILGIVGMNGAGKSTLLKIISGITQPSMGDITVNGNIVPLLELGSGFNPEFSGIENIYFYNTIMGYSRKQTDLMLQKIIDFAEIGDFVYQPLKTYSSGMRARLAFAVAVNIDPDILILDEVLSVGDDLFRRKSFAKIEEFFKAGKTILFVSHAVQSVNQLCTRAVMLYNGRIVLDGSPKFVTMHYQKFIFSPHDKRVKLLQAWKNNQFDDQEEQLKSIQPILDIAGNNASHQVQQTQKVNSGAYFIPNFDSKSVLITKNYNVSVSQVKILNVNGQEVNCLIPNETYSINYEIDCNEDIGPVTHGIGIKTEMGVVITWRFHPGSNEFSEKDYMKGDHIAVKWSFRCVFSPATYFIGVNLKKMGDEGPEMVFKGADYDVFKVEGVKSNDRGGFFDPDFAVEISG